MPVRRTTATHLAVSIFRVALAKQQPTAISRWSPILAYAVPRPPGDRASETRAPGALSTIRLRLPWWRHRTSRVPDARPIPRRCKLKRRGNFGQSPAVQCNREIRFLHCQRCCLARPDLLQIKAHGRFSCDLLDENSGAMAQIAAGSRAWTVARHPREPQSPS